ncbi:substrate-binding domain-containing protein [Methylocella sp.]|jgi:tungstate transport system substrate-binding protein|uniref:substrate-binding domain-containing protein n=1 Tax=Methylocella sp. TaxID=1978226 RepID=UPI003C24FA13
MSRRNVLFQAFVLVFLAASGLGPSRAEEPFVTVASTTSTEQSGLFSYLIPLFKKDSGIDVRVIAVGTGQALAIGARGDADALLVHDRQGEDKFVADGNGIDRRDVMYNDFILIGPKSDPAKIRGEKDAKEALRKIAAAKAPFASRGDDSGTHRLELRLWKAAGVDVSPAKAVWRRETGSGMGPTLNLAAGIDAYVLADRATWANFKNRQNLEILSEGDPGLLNRYGSILVNPARFPHVKADAARRWHEWLTSEAGRRAIADFKVNGEQVFFLETAPI